MSAPTTEQVQAWLADEEGAAEFDRYASDGIQDRASASARTLREVALPIAEHRDAVIAERDVLAAEVKRLREVIATKHAIERSSVGVAALAEECETLRAELKRLRQAFLAKSIRLLVAEQPKKEDEGG